MKEYAVVLQNVSKTYKDHTVLNNISMELERGKIHGFIGYNGSGKTVLFKLICGFIKVSSGNICVMGQNITKEYNNAIKIGAIVEVPGFIPYKTGFKNLFYLAQLSSAASKEDIEKAMITVGLDPKSKKPVNHYSLGMKQRLGIAQAIMENPDLLVLDEPFNGLDKEGVAEMHKLLQQLKEKGVTILLASHSQTDIDSLCDTVHELDAGNMQAIR